MSFDFYKRAAIVCRAIPFTPDGWQVDRKKDGWHNTMDEAMQFQQIFGSLGI